MTLLVRSGCCFGVGARAGKCGVKRVNDRYCAECMAIMVQWCREVREAARVQP